ncbi:hypothetical protein [Methylocaldum gracile]|uniref:hypothetical protein n=1 Tax=unclassified Methylocaldum TaxID=2622260 RepID=UPI00105E8F7A
MKYNSKELQIYMRRESMKNRLGMMCLICGLTGCAHSLSEPTARSIYLPSGEPAYQITCEERGLAKDSCYRKAGDLCGTRGYDEIGLNDERQMNEIFDMVTGAIRQGKTAPIVEKTIVIRCKRPSAGARL